MDNSNSGLGGKKFNLSEAICPSQCKCNIMFPLNKMVPHLAWWGEHVLTIFPGAVVDSQQNHPFSFPSLPNVIKGSNFQDNRPSSKSHLWEEVVLATINK